MKQKAKAWVFESPGKELIEKSIDFPILNDGEVLVENQYCTICKSDLHTFTGNRPGPVPSVLGHEIIGRVVQLPDNFVCDFSGEPLCRGDLITWTLSASCGKCRNCKNGFPQKCTSLKKYGHEKMEGHFLLSGGFATHTHLYPGTSIFKLPENIDPRILAGLNCSWATVTAATRLAGDITGKNVLITGAGMLGMLAVAFCKEKGAARILVVEQNQLRLKLAGEFGADCLIEWNENNEITGDAIAKATDGEMIDVGLEMSGANQALALGLEVAGIGATLVWAGSVFPVENIEVNPEKIVRGLVQIKGIHNYTPHDLQQAIYFLKENHQRYPFDKLFCKKDFAFEEVDGAIEKGLSNSCHRVAIKIDHK